jgi:adenosylcobinamide-phosphate synthase
VLIGLLLKPVFAFRGLLKAAGEVYLALKTGSLDEARRLVSWHLVSRNTRDLSNRQVASATIESLAENLTDSFLAPLFFFVLGGLPLAWFYRFINTADTMVAYHTPELEFFGKPSARLDDLLNWIPARLAAWMIVISAALCRYNLKKAYKVMMVDHNLTESPNAGWTMAAAAGALDVTLEKKGYYCLNAGNGLPQIMDIQRAVKLAAVALALSLLFCGGIIFGTGFYF